MGTTFEQEPSEIMLSMRVNNDLNNAFQKSISGRGFKRPIEEDDTMPVESPAVAGMPLTNRENSPVKVKKYLESNWESDQPPVQAEIEVLASSTLTAEILPQASRHSARTKEQQAQLPKQLKDSLKHLKNLLKLPKARRWVYCEYFYSDIDRELLMAEYEFRQCLLESFPNLKTHLLRRAEWRQVRRLIGKPRRCSQAFFDSERSALDARRRRVRNVQKGATLTWDSEEIDIPLRIPKPLVVGATVCARIRHPKDGIYAGTVDAVMDGRYRIIFDKDVVMPLIVADFEIMSLTYEETGLIPVSFLLERNRAAVRNQTYTNSASIFSPIDGSPLKSTVTANDPVLSSVNCSSATANVVPSGASASASAAASTPYMTSVDRCGNYPLRLIVMLVKVSKLINIKRMLIAQMQEMNTAAERMHLYTEGYVRKFQERYAKTIVDLEQVNKQLQNNLHGIAEYFGSLLPQLTEVTVTSRPQVLHKFCQTHAAQIVRNNNQSLPVRNRTSLELVTSLTALMLQVRALGQQQCNAFELHTLRQTIEEIKDSLDPSNRIDFEDNVEVHVKQIEFSMQNGDSASLSSGYMDY